MLRFLKKFGKGLATIAGVSIGSAGGATALAAPLIATDANTVAALHEIGVILASAGALLASFGIGRKAGVSPD